MNDTPRTDDLLHKLLIKHGEIWERNAPEVWVHLARTLERECQQWHDVAQALAQELTDNLSPKIESSALDQFNELEKQ